MEREEFYGPPAKRTVRTGERMHDTISDICVLMDAILLAKEHISGRPHRAPLPQGENGSLFSIQIPTLTIRLPVRGPFYAACMSDQIPRVDYEILFQYDEPNPWHKNAPAGAKIRGPYPILSSNVVIFWERYYPWIRSHFKPASARRSDPEQWPETFRFMWALRSAIVHSEGRFNVRDDSRRPFVWMNARYDHTDAEKRRSMWSDIGLGDIILIMFEVSDELDRLGCPV